MGGIIIVTFIEIFLLILSYLKLGYLINPGFVSVYDEFFYRAPFTNSDYVLKVLKENGICDGLFGELTTEYTSKGSNYPFTYAEFWVAENRWLMAMLFIAILLLIINRGLVIIKKMPEYISDIPVYICVILSIGAYYLTVMCFGKYTIEKNNAHNSFLFLAIFSLFAIFFGLYKRAEIRRKDREFEEHKKKVLAETQEEKIKKYSSDDLEDYIIKDEESSAENENKKGNRKQRKNEKKKLSLPLIIMIIEALLFLVPIKFCIEAYKISKDYSVNYGMFDPENMTVRTDLEEGFCGNYMNQAVDTEKGLFFIEDNVSVDYDGEFHHVNMDDFSVRRLDADGTITEIYREDNSDKVSKYDITTIGYADGYLYLSTDYWIIRVDPNDGTSEQVLFAASHYYISDCCVVEGKIYYVERKENTDYERIWVAEINGKEISEPELYASDIQIPNGNFVNNYCSDLLTSYICGEGLVSFLFQESRIQRLDGKAYHLGHDIYYTDKGQKYNSRLFFFDVGDTFSSNNMDYVGGYTIYNDSIYFVQLKETGLDVCKCDLYGNDVKVIDSYEIGKDLTDCTNYYFRIMIGQGKIYVTAAGYIFYNDKGDYGFNEPGTVSFVTDLD